MINKIIRIYLLLSIIASFSPLPKNDQNTENCMYFTNTTTYSPIKLAKLGTRMSEASGRTIMNTIEKCKMCNQAFCSLKPIYNNPIRKCFYANCIEITDHCGERTCKKAKYPFPTPSVIWNKLGCSETKSCLEAPLRDISRGNTLKDVITRNLFPNYNIIKQRTSATEIWIGIFTFVGILCFLRLTG